MYYVYVLYDKKRQKPYIGYTSDLNRRLEEHRAKKDPVLIYFEAYVSEKDARLREQKLKAHGSGWVELKKRLIHSLP